MALVEATARAKEGEAGTPHKYAPKPLALKREFVEWLFTPVSEREHPTRQLWAQAHDVSPQTLSEWNYDEDVLAMIAEWRRLLEAAWPAVAGTMVKIATTEDHPQVVQAGRTVAQWLDKEPTKKVHMDVQVNIASVYASAADALEGEFTEPEALPAPDQ